MSRGSGQLDRRALEELYSRLEKPITNVVYRTLWSMPESQDIAQEAFVRLWAMRGRVRLDSVEALVWKIAMNLASKRRRWLRMRRFFGLEGHHAADEPVDSALAEHARRARVRTAVDALPADLRDVVMLTTFSELSYTEVADVLGIPAGTVASRKNKAVNLLREQLVEAANV